MRLIIIAGQTATGKTNQALELAKRENGELVNCDSRQIYKKLDIITGKDIRLNNFTKVGSFYDCDIGYYAVENNIKLWLYDVVDPQKHFSSFEFTQCAIVAIKDIISRNKTPILVGGTAFYLKHLLFDVSKNKVAPDWNLRAELSLLDLKQLQGRYKKLDPSSFEKLNNSELHNPQRLMRKIEIAAGSMEEKHIETKTTLADKLGVDRIEPEWHIILKERSELEGRIRQRVEVRIKQGAVDEIKSLLHAGYEETDPGLKTIGYQELIPYIKGKYSLDRAKELWITHELQYAKRQKTFFKKLINTNQSFTI